MITQEIPQRVALDKGYQNARRNSDKRNARVEHDRALTSVLIGLMKDDTQLFKRFSDDKEFKLWLSDTVFAQTYAAPTAA